MVTGRAGVQTGVVGTVSGRPNFLSSEGEDDSNFQPIPEASPPHQRSETPIVVAHLVVEEHDTQRTTAAVYNQVEHIRNATTEPFPTAIAEESRPIPVKGLKYFAALIVVAAAVSVVKNGLPVPAANTTTRPASKCAKAAFRAKGSQTVGIGIADMTSASTPASTKPPFSAMAFMTVANMPM